MVSSWPVSLHFVCLCCCTFGDRGNGVSGMDAGELILRLKFKA